MNIEALRAEAVAAAHPAANVFPIMGDDELRLLADDIRANGLREPIFRDADDLIVDGRNRWIACRLADKHCGAIKFGPEHGDPIAFIVSHNIHRRHMSSSQLAVCAAELATLEHGTNRYERKIDPSKEGSTNNPTLSVRDAAALVGASRPQAERARQIKRENPEGFQAIKEGKKTVGAVMREMGKPTDAAEKRKRATANFAAPVTPIRERPVLVHDATTEMAEQACHLLLRFRELSKKIGPEELYAKFPARLRHNLDIALADASFFVGDLHGAWAKDQTKKNAAV